MLKYWLEYRGHTFTTSGKRNKYENTIYTFDIETTSYLYLNNKVLPTNEYLNLDKKEQEKCLKQSTMYIWMFGINDDIYYGRTWHEFYVMLQKVNYYSPYIKYVFVHNLSFEFQFMKSIFNMKKVVSRKTRKVMYCELDDFPMIFRCTYYMTNSSLAKLPSQFNLNVEKKVGDLDYTLLRNSETKLSEKELGYCEYDCLVLYEYIKKELETYETLKNLPLTATGKVRKQLKEKVKNNYTYRKKVYKAVNIDPHIYNMLVEGFARGLYSR